MDLLNILNGYIWSMPQIVLLLGTGLLFTLAMKCTQIRMIPTMIKLLFSGKKSEHGLSSFQAFTLAIAGRVGVGNIAGVATAAVSYTHLDVYKRQHLVCSFKIKLFAGF